MRYSYKNDPTLCRAPLLGNGDIALTMDAEGGITKALPAPIGLPAPALFRLGKRNADGEALSYCTLTPAISFLGRALGCPYYVTSEFSTDDATFTSVCKYDRGVTVETSAAVLAGHPVLMITKRFSAQGPIVFSYDLSPLSGLVLSLSGNLLVGERAEAMGRERLCFFSPDATPMLTEDGGGRLVASLPKKATVTFFLFFADTEDPARLPLNTATKDMQSFLCATGEKLLLSEHTARWQSKEGRVLSVEDGALCRILDGSRYLLRTSAALWGARAGLPSCDLRLFSTLLREGCVAEAARLLPTLLARIPQEEPKRSFSLFRNRTPNRANALAIADAAIAIYRYYLITGDRFFLAREGFPAMQRAARILLREAVHTGYSETYVLVPDPIAGGLVSMRPYYASVAVAECLFAFAEAAAALNLEPALSAEAARAATAIMAGLPNPPRALAQASDAHAARAAYHLSVYPTDRYMPPVPEAVEGGVYPSALYACALAARRLSAASVLRELAKTADVFGFLPHKDGAAPAEVAALFLEAYARSIAEPIANSIYLGFGLGAGTPNTDFRLPLTSGVVVEGKLRDGRFTTLRLFSGPARFAREIELVVPSELYASGAAVAIRKTEKEGRLHIATVLH